MTCRMAIRGIGLAGGFGCGCQAALNALANGSKPNDFMDVKIPTGTVSYPVYLADPASLKEFVKPQKLRRVNRYSRLATLAAAMALEDAGQSIDQRSETGVIVASGYGASTTTFAFLDDILLEGDIFASPTLFSNSVHSAAASHITILLQIKGPCLTVVQFEMSMIGALFNAYAWLRDRKVDTVLLGGVDEINHLLLYCYHNFYGDDIPYEIKPLDYGTQTAIPGEGAAFMVLTRDEGDVPAYGYIDGLSWENPDEYVVPEDVTIVPGLDGHRACGLQYRKLLHGVDRAKIKTFSQIYGSMPSGQVFDVALGCVAARNGLIPNSYCSVKLSAKGNLGIVHHS
ncbi:MAG: beta-ketoacyl synthase N-terminal-like domain-containing protein [Planctomycetota bacterium]